MDERWRRDWARLAGRGFRIPSVGHLRRAPNAAERKLLREVSRFRGQKYRRAAKCDGSHYHPVMLERYSEAKEAVERRLSSLSA